MLPPDSLAAHFAQRIALRDNPPPPPPLSHEPAAVQARIEDWLRAAHPQRDRRATYRQGQALLGFMQNPQLTAHQLQVWAGLGERATLRLAQTLVGFGLITYTTIAGTRHYRLTDRTEDALLLVVAGPEGLS